MTASITLSGVTFTPDGFSNYGWVNTTVTVNGSTYIQILGLFAAAMSDIGLGLQTTATSTHNLSTMNAGDAVTVTLATNRAYSLGGYELVAFDANNYFIMQATATCTTTSLVGTVKKVVGSGSHTAWTVSNTGKIGDTGTGGLTNQGFHTAAFNILQNESHIVDLNAAGANVTGTLGSTWSADDKFEVYVIGDGSHTFTLNGTTNSIKIRGSIQDGTVTASGLLSGKYKNSGQGFQTAFAPDNT